MTAKPVVARSYRLFKTVLARCMLVLDAEYSNVRALSAFDHPLANLLLAEVLRAHDILTHLLQNGPVGCGDWLSHLRRIPLFASTVFAHKPVFAHEPIRHEPYQTAAHA